MGLLGPTEVGGGMEGSSEQFTEAEEIVSGDITEASAEAGTSVDDGASTEASDSFMCDGDDPSSMGVMACSPSSLSDEGVNCRAALRLVTGWWVTASGVSPPSGVGAPPGVRAASGVVSEEKGLKNDSEMGNTDVGGVTSSWGASSSLSG